MGITVPPVRQSVEEATVNAMLAIVEAVRNPENLMKTSKDLIATYQLSEEKKKEYTEALQTIEKAKVESEILEKNKNAHADYVAQSTADIGSKTSKANELMQAATQLMEKAESRHRLANAREDNITKREAEHAAAISRHEKELIALEKKSSDIKAYEDKLALKHKRLMEAVRE